MPVSNQSQQCWKRFSTARSQGLGTTEATGLQVQEVSFSAGSPAPPMRRGAHYPNPQVQKFLQPRTLRTL